MKSISLVVHGLNFKPEKMNAISELLRSIGSDPILVFLKGHKKDQWQDFKTIDRSDWLADIREAHQEAINRASGLKIPLIGVGFSLGGILLHDYLNTPEISDPPQSLLEMSHSILFAPAMGAPKALGLFRFLPKSLPLPSLSLFPYKSHPLIPIAGYRALFDLMVDLEKKKYIKSNIPSLIFLNPKDLLVSHQKIESISNSYLLDRWKLCVLDSDPTAKIKHFSNHLFTDPESAGFENWKKIQTEITNFLTTET